MRRLLFLYAFMGVVSIIVFCMDLAGYFSPVHEPIAVVTEARGTVRRLENDGFSWDRAGQGTLLALRDAVSTGEGSYAKIGFSEGAEIELHPGAMVVINHLVHEVVLNFISGTGVVRIARSAESKFKVEEPSTGRVKVDLVEDSALPPTRLQPGKPVAPAKPRNEEPAVGPAISESAVKNPSAALRTQDEVAKFDHLPAAPEIVSPPSSSSFDLARQREIPLKWQAPPQAVQSKLAYEITIRPLDDTNGKVPIKLIRSDTPEFCLQGIPAGKYDWSVRAVAGPDLRSPASAHRWFEVSRTAMAEIPKPAPVQAPRARPAPAPKKHVNSDRVKLLPVSVE